METPIIQRIRVYLKNKRWTINSLSKQLNIPQTTLNRQLSDSSYVGVEVITGMLAIFPDLSAEWLLRGTEPMERIDTAPDPELNAVCIDQAKEIYKLKQRIAELEGEKKERA